MQEADGSLPHLSTKQSLKHLVPHSCSESVSHQGLKLLCWSSPSSCCFLSKTGLFSPDFPHQDISLAVAVLFQLKVRPKHGSLLLAQTQIVQSKASASKFEGQDPPGHTLQPEAVSTIPGPSCDSLGSELCRHAGTSLSGSSPSCLQEISGGDQT